jgi:hypothetical protein
MESYLEFMEELRIPNAIRLFKLPIRLPALGGLPFGRL